MLTGLRSISIVTLLILVGFAGVVFFEAEPASAYIIRGVISIDSNAKFTSGNGVSKGSGTEFDPYIIEGWQIAAQNDIGIYIRNTDAHFIIRNSYVHASNRERTCILIIQVKNGAVENCTVKQGLNGISIDDSDNIRIDDNTAFECKTAIDCRFSNNLVVKRNSANNNNGGGIFVEYGNKAVVEDNTANDNDFAFRITNFANLTVSNNYGADTYNEAFDLNNCKNFIFDNNTALTSKYGIICEGLKNVTLEHNEFSFNTWDGIKLSNCEDITIRNNLISENSQNGLKLYYTHTSLIYHNSFLQNIYQGANEGYNDNSWDLGYPQGGNYWDHLDSADFKYGPKQDKEGADGIADSAFMIGLNQFDNYPLMAEYNNAKPDNPINLKGEGGDSYINITWDPPSQAEGFPIIYYRLYRGIESDELFQLIDIGQENDFFFKDDDLKNGITYYYRMTGVSLVGEGSASSEMNAQPVAVPGIPLYLTAVGHDDFVNLEWSMPDTFGGFDIMRYLIYRGNTTDNPVYHDEIGNVTYYNDTSVQNGETYFYRIRAKNKIGIGGHSNTASAKPLGLPSAPINLEIAVEREQININWMEPVSDGGTVIEGYRIYRDTEPQGDTLLYEVKNKLFFNDTDVIVGTTYFYNITALNVLGEGQSSNYVSIQAVGVPSEPQNLQITAGDTFAHLTWDEPETDGHSTITNYKIFRGATDSVFELLIKTGNVLEYNDTDLIPNTKYYYRISAVNKYGDGAESTAIRITTLPLPNVPPTALIKTDFTTGYAPLKVQFTGEGDDIDGRIIRYTWEFGDGNSSTLQSPNFVYYFPGEYPVTLTVTDDSGAETRASIQITVLKDPGEGDGGGGGSRIGDVESGSNSVYMVAIIIIVSIIVVLVMIFIFMKKKKKQQEVPSLSDLQNQTAVSGPQPVVPQIPPTYPPYQQQQPYVQQQQAFGQYPQTQYPTYEQQTGLSEPTNQNVYYNEQYDQSYLKDQQKQDQQDY
jgi:parallel beta-helix repeat protein